MNDFSGKELPVGQILIEIHLFKDRITPKEFLDWCVPLYLISHLGKDLLMWPQVGEVGELWISVSFLTGVHVYSEKCRVRADDIMIAQSGQNQIFSMLLNIFPMGCLASASIL